MEQDNLTKDDARKMDECLENINNIIYQSQRFWEGRNISRNDVKKILDQLEIWASL